MPAPMVSVRDLCMEFNGKRVLDRVTFDVAEGEIVGIIGRSGAGKTVLMHLLRGLEGPPAAGSVIYHMAACRACERMERGSAAGTACPACGDTLVPVDVDLWDPSKEDWKDRVMRRTAIMFQRSFALYGNDRVIENVLKVLDETSYPQEQVISRAADLIDQVRLSHRMMHIARDLSGGEKQRVVLARQLAREPFLLFADEPTGTLDPETSALVHRLLVDATDEGQMGLVVTSHFSRVIREMAHRVIFLNEGRILVDGPPKQVIGQFLKKVGREKAAPKVDAGRDLLTARGLTKRYISVDRGVVRAVNDVDFSLKEKEIFGIVGTSGAGKTTLSRIAAGIIEPTSGEMNFRIGDTWVDMTKAGIEERGRAKPYIGLLHQEYDLYPHRTVLDNLTDAIGLEFPMELAMRKAGISLQLAGFDPADIPELLQRYPGQLSEGERHRVALAQVLIREPRLVILDEPTGTMDPITREDVKHSILHARAEMEETFLIVSHDMEFVLDLCDRVALMKGGKIVRIGLPAQVLSEVPDVEAAGAAAGNPGRAQAGSEETGAEKEVN